jgi:hypothetical protein
MGVRAGIVFAKLDVMAHGAVDMQPMNHDDHMDEERVRIGDECLELNPVTTEEVKELRAWVRRINGTTYAQPYFVEGPPGHFRLYVGEAAERVRTAQGIR